MNWRKLGRIYEPRSIGDWSASHASVPIAHSLDSHTWRIFHSARDRWNRSHTTFFDLDIRRPFSPLRVSSRPSLSPGARGLFDEHGAMGAWVVRNSDRLRLYYIGWNLGTSVPFRNAIGIAESTDGGESFVRLSDGPVVDRSTHDPCFTASPCVIAEADRWRLWYLSCVGWDSGGGTPMPRYHIKYAESADGVEWCRRGVVAIDFGRADEYAISRPCVIRDHALYRMWYSTRGQRYRIGYAESDDGVRWTRLDSRVGIDVSEAGWDSEMICYAFVFDADGERYMLYNGNDFGASGIGLAVLESD